jgi:hypothetical protein
MVVDRLRDPVDKCPRGFATDVSSRGHLGGRRIGAARPTAVGDEERRPTMASTPMVRADAYGLLPSILILLMLILASLGIVAHAATL